VSCYNLIVTRQYFTNSINPDIYEAALIDGSGEGRCFLKIALPLSKPILAVMALYHIVGHWNSFFSALIYIRDKQFYPLQLVLRNILISGQLLVRQLQSENNVIIDEEMLLLLIRRAELAQAMKYAIVIVAVIPMLIAYPFVQKHFVKGVMIGSVKG